MEKLPKIEDPSLLYGYDTLGDAGVYAISDDLALVQTVDLLTPIADDPYTFGQIAAANSLSDLYAMGAKPISALNVIGFPVGKLDLAVLNRILEGGMDKTKEAGAVILGGHTIKDEEIKYGLAATGIIKRGEIITSSGAKPKDRLIITKPLGTGVISTALKAGIASKGAIEKINHYMIQLNNVASEVMKKVGVDAATDITGFGLLGHLLQMVQASGVGAEVYGEKVPIIEEAFGLAEKKLFPGGSKDNFNYVRPHTSFASGIGPELQVLLCDAQTSGGLLIAVSFEKTEKLLRLLQEKGVEKACVIGKIIERRRLQVI